MFINQVKAILKHLHIIISKIFNKVLLRKTVKMKKLRFIVVAVSFSSIFPPCRDDAPKKVIRRKLYQVPHHKCHDKEYKVTSGLDVALTSGCAQMKFLS